MGVLGLIYRNCLTCRACGILVFYSKYERRQQCQDYDWCHMAIISNTTQRHPRVTGHRDEYHDQLLDLLAR